MTVKFVRINCVSVLLMVGLALPALAGGGGPARWQAPAPSGLAILADDEGVALSLDGSAPFHRTANEIRNERLIDVSGTSIRLVLWEEVLAEGQVEPYYAISLDGESMATVRSTSYVLKLRHGDFDPEVAVPPVAPLLAADDETNLHIVQFVTPPLEEFRAQIAALGGTAYNFLAHHAHIVKMSAEVRDQVARLPYVRWVGPYHPAYRLEEFMLDNRARADKLFPLQRYNIMVFEAGLGQKTAVGERIEGLGGTVDRLDAGKFLVEATLTPEQLFEVVRWDEVLFVDRWSPYEVDMNNARELGGANYIETVAGYTGAGVRGEVFDNGFNQIHLDFQSRPLIPHGQVGTASHGASTSGICFGDGTGDPTARGLLPEGQGIIADYNYIGLEGPSRYQHTGELVEAPYFGVFQTASVGSGRTLEYTNVSADTDAALFDFDIVHCQSQSNAGNQMSRPQAWAKNIIAGGAAYHYDTLTMDDDRWNHGASIGPAADGRIKPDLCGFYDAIRTTSCCTPTSYTSSFGGTSGATPIIAGHVGLFFQMWSEGIFGNDVDPQGTVFENRAHMTTAKAMLINTAQQYPFSGASHDLTRVHQGWGWPDVGNMYDLREQMFVIDETEILPNLGSVLYTLDVAPGAPALKATLVYADLPGTTSSNQHRINDLTLKVTSPTGTVYWGNNGLLEGNWSTPGGSRNTKDTVENVFVQDPQAGQWAVEIFADEVNQDSHVETPQLDADFALVVSGVTPVQPALYIRLPQGVPETTLPNTPVEIAVEILPAAENLVPGTALLHYRFDPQAAFISEPLTEIFPTQFLATVPGAFCDDEPQFYFSAEGDGGTVIYNPHNAPASFYSMLVGEEVVYFVDDFETDKGWTVENENLQTGAWERAIPSGSGGARGDPPTDFDGSGHCYITGNGFDEDVDGGPTRLTSPALDLSSGYEHIIGYARWFYSDGDTLEVEVSNGGPWVLVESVSGLGGWVEKSFRVADFVTPNATVRVRFTTADQPNDSVTEAGLDAFSVWAFECEEVGETIVPDDFTIVRGQHVSGGLADLFESDDSYLLLWPNIILTPTEPPVWVIVEGTATMASPTRLRFKLEAYATTTGLVQKIELYNYVTQSYEELDSRNTTLADSVVEVVVTGDPSRFIEPGTLAMQAQMTWRFGPVGIYAFDVGIDQTIWTLVP